MQQASALTEGSIARILLRFAFPILYTSALQALNATVSIVWVGRYLGEVALTAVSNAQSVLLLLTGTTFGIATAARILIGQHWGAGDLTAAKRVVGTSATFFAAISVPVSIAGLAFAEPLMAAINTPPDSLPMAVAYIRVVFIALPISFVYAFVTSILLGTGDSRTPFYFILLSVAINLILNPVLIGGVGAIPGIGITGAAVAQFVSLTVTLAALFVHLYRQQHPMCLHKNELAVLRPNGSVVRILLSKGIPLGAHVLVLSLSSMLMLVLVNRFGVDVSAAFGVSMQIWIYIQMPAIALSAAVITMAAVNVGGEKWDRVGSIAHIGACYSALLTGSIILVMYALDTRLYALFLPTGSAALPIASHINAVIAWSLVFVSMSGVLLGVVRATGVVMVPLFINILALLVVRFPLAAVLIDRWRDDAIWWSFPISHALTFALAISYYRYGGWRSAQLRTSVRPHGIPTPPQDSCAPPCETSDPLQSRNKRSASTRDRD